MSKKDKKYEFNETFIDRNIGELCKEYDLIHGISIDVSRITPDVIDGLKPVQRRALYAMYLKDGGKHFRKLASISGDTFGLFHPHCLTGDTHFVMPSGQSEAIGTLEKIFHPSDKISSIATNKITKDNIVVLSFDADKKEYQWSKLVDVRITKYVDEVYILNTTNGRIGCTNDHKFLVVKNISDDDYRWEWTKCEDLVKGDILCSCMGEIGTVDKNTAIASYINDEYLNSDLDYLLDQGISIVDNIKKIECNNLPMYDFTVEDTECAFVYTGESVGATWNKAILAHNSPTSIEGAIVNMAQPWKNIIGVIEPKGNHGDKSGSEAGASRYIQDRISEFGRDCYFDDWKDSVVDMKMSYNEENEEPIYLPAKYPVILLNGCLGLG